MKNKYIVTDGESTYDATVSKTTVTLLHSTLDKTWTNPGSFASKLFSTGNGLIITFDSGDTIELDYCEAYEMMVLLILEQKERQQVNQGLPSIMKGKFEKIL